MARKVEVCSYDDEWTKRFEDEAKVLKNIFKDELVAVHHIGSTAVPGLKAKPIIDLMPVIRNIERVDLFNEDMERVGYETLGENGLAGRRYFQKGGEQRSHHVHVYQFGSPEIYRHIAFRDYLSAHPEIKTTYGELKEKLAKQFPYDIESYIAGKNDLVSVIEEKACRWFYEEND
ncbi:GrpB domain, predicted nucleotidyltransferase, UPF0157 family [Pelagirhabdus alkalitolerans]|uniref:GrpB domain, predicted nucleotidyltransferase, UPF0157 family n=1 Tax=Pelagirhabdus alkalitolerans TaxID=1612202 RepID=A0A1G6JX93_9BACI|nr:GrpB family protein [Pelagirhabdus alkalitolerans]SDC23241.1 GrpB domain, predicted nucleotidyltransferase, UPF0157 family [Pelagirhabdus alkalitolerans]